MSPRQNWTSRKASQFTESVIREMTRQAMRHNAVNLAQGFPDFSAPEEIKRAAQAAIDADVNQYAITWGARDLRQAIAAHAKKFQGLEIDPETEITVCCGSTEAMIAFVFELNAARNSFSSNVHSAPSDSGGRSFTNRGVASERITSGP